jgi:VWFA-related protein
MRRITLLLVFALFAITCNAGNKSNTPKTLTFVKIDSRIVEGRLKLPVSSPEDRLRIVRKQFQAAGCQPTQIVEQSVPGQKLPNLTCTVPGTSGSTILITAPLDYKSKGGNAKVEWGTLELLPLLAESLYGASLRHTLVFAAFAGTDSGQAGANYYLSQLSAQQRTSLKAVVALDHIGRTPIAYAFPSAGDSTTELHTSRSGKLVVSAWSDSLSALTRYLPDAAHRVGLPYSPVRADDDLERVTDTKPFSRAGIPSISIFSPAYTQIATHFGIPTRQIRTEIVPKTLSDTYLLLCAYFVLLDYDLGKSLPAPAMAAQPSEPTQQAATESSQISIPQAPSVSTPQTVSMKSPDTPAVAPPQLAIQPAVAAHDLPQSPLQTPTVFKVDTSLVLLDVVVTDKQGQTVEGLNASDFSVLEDGKPQSVLQFERHAPAPRTASAEPKLPPHTYANIGTTQTPSVSVVMLDLLNTPLSDHLRARQTLLRYLKSLPPGRPVALYALTTNLQAIQGMTDDADLLVQALDRVASAKSALLTNEAERQQAQGATEALARNSIAGSANVAGAGLFAAAQAARLMRGLKESEAVRLDGRVMLTLEAFKSLARALAGYPGRKSVIWLSGAFPVRLQPDMQTADPWHSSREYSRAMEETTRLLAAARVAVNPVDVRGVQTSGIALSLTSAEAAGYVGNTDNASSGTSSNYGRLLSEQWGTSVNERALMMDVAEQTRGRAFVGSNDIEAALRRAIDDGLNYYSVTYRPSAKGKSGEFHRIEVRVNRPDLKLSYRRGYFSGEQATQDKLTGPAALFAATQPGVPNSTMLLVRASVQPPDAEHKQVRIQYIVNASGVTLTDTTGNRKQALIDFLAIAYDMNGKEVVRASDTLDAAIPPAALEGVLRNGLPASQELTLAPGTYNLRLGIMDQHSQQIGTLDVPLIVP